MRLSYALLRRAYSISPLLPLLLRECRDLSSAANELRWLADHARSARLSLPSLVQQRAAGKPLQYILGDQPFGDLQILCRPGVLIPRPDTESYTTRIARHLLKAQPASLRIIDLCTGTGCIPLLLHALLAPRVPSLSLTAVDISTAALGLARANLAHNIANGALLARAADEVRFVQADLLSGDALPDIGGRYDLLISNPPYISPAEFGNGTTRRSVRLYEPTLALVPPALEDADADAGVRREDTFYPRLMGLAERLEARYTVLECGDLAQAERVAALHAARPGKGVAEIWRCDWDEYSDAMPESTDEHGARAVVISATTTAATTTTER